MAKCDCPRCIPRCRREVARVHGWRGVWCDSCIDGVHYEGGADKREVLITMLERVAKAASTARHTNAAIHAALVNYERYFDG